jgi:hypothetical protein
LGGIDAVVNGGCISSLTPLERGAMCRLGVKRNLLILLYFLQEI